MTSNLPNNGSAVFKSAALIFYVITVTIANFIHYNLMSNDHFGEKQKVRLEENICVHIFSVSAAMVGVCLTVIGIIQIVITSQGLTTLADDFLALDALLFLISCILSYWAMRMRRLNRMHQIERIADIVFITALVFMVFICITIAYEISYHKATALVNGYLQKTLSI